MNRNGIAQHLKIARGYRRQGQRFQAGLWLGMALGMLGEPSLDTELSKTSHQVDNIASYFYDGVLSE